MLETKHSLEYTLLQCLSVVQAPMTETFISPMDVPYDTLNFFVLMVYVTETLAKDSFHQARLVSLLLNS